MKKIAYMTPEMEIVNLNYKTTLLAGSDGGGSTPEGQDDPVTPPVGGDY